MRHRVVDRPVRLCVEPCASTLIMTTTGNSDLARARQHHMNQLAIVWQPLLDRYPCPFDGLRFDTDRKRRRNRRTRDQFHVYPLAAISPLMSRKATRPP